MLGLQRHQTVAFQVGIGGEVGGQQGFGDVGAVAEKCWVAGGL